MTKLTSLEPPPKHTQKQTPINVFIRVVKARQLVDNVKYFRYNDCVASEIYRVFFAIPFCTFECTLEHEEITMSDLWLGLANKIVNSYRTEWDKYPFGSRAQDKIIDAIVDKHKLEKHVVQEIIYVHEYGYIDADDVDLGEKVGIDNPEWEHKPEAFLVFKAIHQMYAHDNSFYFERAGGYKSW